MSGIKGLLVNLVLAGAVGLFAAGPMGAIMAMLVLCAAFGLFLLWHRFDQGQAKGGTRHRSQFSEAIGALTRFVSIPFGFAAVFVLTMIALVTAALAPLVRPLKVLGRVAGLPARSVRFVSGLFDESNLPWSLGNITLLLIFGILVLGIDLAFYVALIAVPLLLLALAMLAITGGEDPEEVAEEQH